MAKSKQDVLAAARAILDEYGLADLTMRRLADALEVKPGALYWHYPSKQALLAAIADSLLADVPAPASGTWREAVASWSLALRSTLLPHRDAADVVATARAMGLASTDVAAPIAGVLRGAGLPEAEAAAAADTLTHFILGHLIQEQGREHWRRAGGELGEGSHAVDSSTFGYGVGLVLDGIAAALQHVDDGVADDAQGEPE